MDDCSCDHESHPNGPLRDSYGEPKLACIIRVQQKLISEQSDTIDLLTAIITERDETIKLQKAMNRSNLRIIGEQETILDRLTAALRTKVARFLCPVHGSATCPEEYMLQLDGEPWGSYRSTWSEDMRCGQRFTLDTLLAEGE